MTFILFVVACIVIVCKLLSRSMFVYYTPIQVYSLASSYYINFFLGNKINKLDMS